MNPTYRTHLLLVATLTQIAAANIIEASVAAPTCAETTRGPSGQCVAALLPSDTELCNAAANETCYAAAAAYRESVGECGEAAATVGGGFPVGMVVSLIADVIISIGLALQKVAHNRISEREKAAKAVGTDPDPNAKKPSMTKEPIWWMGILLTVGGELGNFAAYGDPNTPASVVTAVGCVGVISNQIIATVFLGEPYRRRDIFGVGLVSIGVTLVVIFAPQQPCALTASRFYFLLAQPGSIVLLVLLTIAIVTLVMLVPKYGERHVLWNLSCASLIASFTVLASKAVATFVTLTIQGATDPNVPFNDQVDMSVTNKADCVNGTNGQWGWLANVSIAEPPMVCITVEGDWFNDAIRDANGFIIKEGSQQLTEWALYVCLVILVVTAVAQVKYINEGMRLFGNSEVIPAHYVTFVLYSIVATTIFYQEFNADNLFHLHLFLDGAMLTFSGVYLITSGRKDEGEGEGEARDTDGLLADGEESSDAPIQPPPGAKTADVDVIVRDESSRSMELEVGDSVSDLPNSAKSRRLTVPGPRRSTVSFEGIAEAVLTGIGSMSNSGPAMTIRRSVVVVDPVGGPASRRGSALPTSRRGSALPISRRSSALSCRPSMPPSSPPVVDETSDV